MLEYPILAASSFGLGALHALEPGHGKTVVGAYLIGSKGRTLDAVILGLVVTLTHSGTVILLGILSTVAAAFFVPETVTKVLEVVSGGLIIAVGGWMIGVRLRQARSGHAHPHHYSHTDEHDHAHGGEGELVGTHAGHEGERHHHTHEGHSHDGHDRDHAHHIHTHHHEAHGHSHAPVLKPGERPTLWQLVGLGVSGGIVPCPAALAVLLGAIGIASFVKGLSLVIIFSLGMAATLVAIGIIMVKAANFASQYVAESKWTRIVPVVSAVLITAIGVGLTVRAILHVMHG